MAAHQSMAAPWLTHRSSNETPSGSTPINAIPVAGISRPHSKAVKSFFSHLPKQRASLHIKRNHDIWEDISVAEVTPNVGWSEKPRSLAVA